MKKIILAIFAVIIFIAIITLGVNKRPIDNKVEYNENTMTALGVDLETLERDIIDFILDTYMPTENTSKEECIENISKYLSEYEYNSLLDEIGAYNEDVKNEVSNLKVRYSKDSNNNSHCDEILCTFYLKTTYNELTYRNRVAVVFRIQTDKISSHSIYRGYTQIKND